VSLKRRKDGAGEIKAEVNKLYKEAVLFTVACCRHEKIAKEENDSYVVFTGKFNSRISCETGWMFG
jgi:hypothetical protein